MHAIMESGVSIPYRYDKNRGNSYKRLFSGKQFQFLIGTIKTQCAYGFPLPQTVVSIPYRYDKNTLNEASTVIFYEFQFLIGTIKTQEKRMDHARIRVSIPYRYDKNSIPPYPEAFFIYVSIPYRYDKNRYRQFARGRRSMFQFLIGTIKTV